MKRTIPAAFQETFQRLFKSVPADLKDNAYLQETTKLYLSLGGESLARQNIHNFQQRFPLELSLFNRPAEEENVKTDSDSQTEQAEDTEDTEDKE